jgi:formylglycine-generating enzyme
MGWKRSRRCIEKDKEGNMRTLLQRTMCRLMVAVVCCLLPGLATAWDNLDIPAELRRPGVRLVVVEFYADWCQPCKKAVPLWNDLHEEYKDRGLRLLVVSVGDGGTCSNPGWQPDKVVCDFDGKQQTAFGADTLPQAFLYSWQGSLLIKNGHFDAVKRAVEEYYRSTPRILVSLPTNQDGKKVRKGSALREIVRMDLKRLAKFEMVASDEELTSLRALRKQGYNPNYGDAGRCKLGREVSANSELKVKVFAMGKERTLVLQLYSVESGCMLGSSRARVGSGGLPAASFEAVGALVEQMIGRKSSGDNGGSGGGLSYEELMKKAQDLEAKKQPRSDAEAKKTNELQKEWKKVQDVASRGSLPVSDRVVFVEQFVRDFPDGNPFLTDAEALAKELRSGGIVGAAGKGGIEWVWSQLAQLYFAKTETKVSQYRECVKAGACEAKHYKTRSDNKFCNWGHLYRDDHPMNCMDWYGAEQFCKWADGRLPTEDEWYAEASDGGSRDYPWGTEEPSCSRCVMDDGNTKGSARPETDGCGENHTWQVCSKEAGNSVSGLCDMSGNVWEWTSSKEESAIVLVVLRGGSWFNSNSLSLRASYRLKLAPDSWNYYFGFRCVRSP